MQVQKKSNPGLSSIEAARRLNEYGSNTLQKAKAIHPISILLSQFTNYLTIILLMSTGLSILLGERTEAITIMAIVVLNALLGFFQEYKTEKTIDALRNMAAPHSSVIRDGEIRQIPSEQIVPGDVFLIEAGDRIPADALLLDCYDLHVDESLLTGESIATEKNERSNDAAATIFMGTLAVRGRAKAVAQQTGMHTEMGKIAGMLQEIQEPSTPLQKRLDQLGKYIAIGCLLICGIVSITGILRGEDVLDMVIMGISLSVAAVPEGLSAIVTVALALAVGRMVKQKALLRKLHAVETLGCSSIICTDKTGTLTENKMTVRVIHTLEREYAVTGDGYETKGAFRCGNRTVNPASDPCLMLSLTSACICNNAILDIDSPGRSDSNRSSLAGGTNPDETSLDVKVESTGDPTEIALLVAGRKAGINPSMLSNYSRTNELPFDSERKCMTVFASAKGSSRSYTKGAPDILLHKCTHVYTENGPIPLTTERKAAILSQNEAMGNRALRVLGVAYKEGKTYAEAESGLTFLSLIGMIDPPRKASYEAVAICKQAGIKPVMITGDHVVTAKAIAQDLRIYTPGDHVVTGDELDRMSENELVRTVADTTVFARVSPRHKLSIVRAFQKRGHIVAMTGDGVNDAPAIKEADIGVAMGVSGTDVAKEAAGVILLDDNFATLVTAVEEGRVIYSNIRKFIRYLLSCNVGEVLTMFVGMLLGFPVVLLPIQILWINLVTDGLPAIALGLEPKEGNEMQQNPRGASEGIFARGLLTRIVTRGVMIAFCTLLVFMLFLQWYDHLELARTGAFLTLVVTQIIHVFECKSETKNIFQLRYRNNPWLILAALASFLMMAAVLYLPVMQMVFQTVALNGEQVGTVFLVSLAAPLAIGFLNRRRGVQ